MVSQRLERYVRRTFDEPDAALSRLRTWRISYLDDPPSERLTAAVILLSEHRAARLEDGFRLAERDWRDLLVAAGLAHGSWPSVLRRRFGASREDRLRRGLSWLAAALAGSALAVVLVSQSTLADLGAASVLLVIAAGSAASALGFGPLRAR